MQMKDWIQIVIEIVGNGVILAIFGKWLDLKMKRAERKDELHSSAVKLFYEELIKLNKSMIKVNATVQMKKISNINTILELLEKDVLQQWIEIITVYDTYECELESFEKQYRILDAAWNEFTEQNTPEGLGMKLDEFKKANKQLIKAVSKKC